MAGPGLRRRRPDCSREEAEKSGTNVVVVVGGQQGREEGAQK
jgi:hypothetical protein